MRRYLDKSVLYAQIILLWLRPPHQMVSAIELKYLATAWLTDASDP